MRSNKQETWQDSICPTHVLICGKKGKVRILALASPLTLPLRTMFWLPHSTDWRLTLFPDAWKEETAAKKAEQTECVLGCRFASRKLILERKVLEMRCSLQWNESGISKNQGWIRKLEIQGLDPEFGSAGSVYSPAPSETWIQVPILYLGFTALNPGEQLYQYHKIMRIQWKTK